MVLPLKKIARLSRTPKPTHNRGSLYDFLHLFQDDTLNEYKNTNIGNLVSRALALGNLPIAQQAVDLQYTYGAKESFLDQASQLARAYLGRGRQFEAIKMLSQATNVINNQEKPEER